jgi:hypothetical protein
MDDKVSVLAETCDALAQDAERLRMAHVWAIEYGWEAKPAEDQETLAKAAEKLDRFRLKLLQFARQPEKF